MRCPYCNRTLGEGGMLPPRCPHCGENLAATTNQRDLVDGAHRRAATRLNDRLRGHEVARHEGSAGSNSFIAILIVGIIAAALFAAGYVMQIWGGRTLVDVVGWRQERAVAELEADGLLVEIVTRKDDGQPGFVLEMDPAPGVRIEKGSAVKLTISEGRIMPEIVGKTREEAQAALDAEGLSYEFSERPSDGDHGKVVEASVEAGKQLTSDQKVTVYVNGPRRVPEVVGLMLADAAKLVEEQGLKVAVAYIETENAADEGLVAGVSPDPGTELGGGSEVTLRVYRNRKAHLEQVAAEIIEIVYNCPNPWTTELPIGKNLRPYVEPTLIVSYDSPASEVNDYSIWWGIVKRWSGLPEGAPEEFAVLPRALVRIDKLEVDPNEGVVTATITVHWDWTAMGELYSGAYSEDTRTITLGFNENDMLISFYDPMTDIPAYQLAWTTETAEAAADGEAAESSDAA